MGSVRIFLHFSKLGYEMYGIDIEENLKERVSDKIKEQVYH